MKKKAYTVLLLISTLCNGICIAAHEPRGRGYNSNPPDIGLPEGREVFIGLLVGVLTIVIGQLLVRLKDNETMGCIGGLFHIVRIASLIPLIAWICAIGQVVLGLVIGISIIVAIIALVFSKKK